MEVLKWKVLISIVIVGKKHKTIGRMQWIFGYLKNHQSYIEKLPQKSEKMTHLAVKNEIFKYFL